MLKILVLKLLLITLCCFICSTTAYIDTVVDANEVPMCGSHEKIILLHHSGIARKDMKFSILMFFSACHKHVQNFVVLDVSCGGVTIYGGRVLKNK